MTHDERPLDGGDDQIVQTGNGPEDPRETVILRDLFGDPEPETGVYAPGDEETE